MINYFLGQKQADESFIYLKEISKKGITNTINKEEAIAFETEKEADAFNAVLNKTYILIKETIEVVQNK